MKNRFQIIAGIFLLFLLFLQCSQKDEIDKKKATLHEIDRLFLKSEKEVIGIEEKLKNLDHIANKLRSISYDTIPVALYLKVADYYEALQENNRQLTVTRQLYNISKLHKNYLGMGYAAYNISDAYYSKASYDSAYFYLSKAERAANLGKLPQISGYIILNKANILSFKKELYEIIYPNIAHEVDSIILPTYLINNVSF